MSRESLVQLQAVDFSYPGSQTDILKNVHLDIHQGDFVCVVGPSGCGKSTLLNLLAGYQHPSSGQILFKGQPIAGPSWHRGVVFQNQALFPWLTVSENIAFGLQARHMEAQHIHTAVEEMLEVIELSAAKDQYIFELSGGMQQRVQLARVLINQPDLVLLDEPLGALDAITRRKMQEFLRSMWKQSKQTFFMITHDIDEALVLGTKLMIMNKRQEAMEIVPLDYTNRLVAGEAMEDCVGTDYLHLRNRIYQLFDQ